jgi:hypothetical protein
MLLEKSGGFGRLGTKDSNKLYIFSKQNELNELVLVDPKII